MKLNRATLPVLASLLSLLVAPHIATAHKTHNPHKQHPAAAAEGAAAAEAAAAAASQRVEGPLAPMPKFFKRSRLRPRFVQPRRRSARAARTAKPRRAPGLPDFLRRGVLELPWEKEIRRFRRRAERQLGPDPTERLRIALRKLNADPMLRLGYTANVLAPPKADTPAAVAPPVFDRYIGIDANGDGEISRREYMRGNARFIAVGPRGDARRRAYNSRLRSRFRGADRNNDGRITPRELEDLQNFRF